MDGSRVGLWSPVDIDREGCADKKIARQDIPATQEPGVAAGLTLCLLLTSPLRTGLHSAGHDLTAAQFVRAGTAVAPVPALTAVQVVASGTAGNAVRTSVAGEAVGAPAPKQAGADFSPPPSSGEMRRHSPSEIPPSTACSRVSSTGTSRNPSAAGSLCRHAAWPRSSSSWSRLSETVSPSGAGRSALSPTEASTSSTSDTSNPTSWPKSWVRARSSSTASGS